MSSLNFTIFLGHSRLVIGFEEKFNKSRNQNLLLFDPACCQRQMQRLLEKGKGINLTILRKSRNQMKSQQYQIVYVDGIMTDEERKVLYLSQGVFSPIA